MQNDISEMITENLKPTVVFEDWGVISYKSAWDKQTEAHAAMVATKLQYREQLPQLKENQVHKLIFCEHPHVYTLGKSGSFEHLKLDEDGLKAVDAEYFKINRGGDITYHGPGQIVGYFLFDLDCFKPDVHLFVRNIEEGVIRLLADYGIKGDRIKEYTGVWVNKPDGTSAKVCAIGVHLSRWISMHGFAFNVKPKLNYFDNIIACGIQDVDKSVTSLQELLETEVNMEEVKTKLFGHYRNVFEF